VPKRKDGIYLGEPMPLGRVLLELAPELKMRDALVFHQIRSRWKELVGELNARHARPLALRNGVLFVAASDSSWMMNLQFIKHRFLEELNRMLRESAAKEQPAAQEEQKPFQLADIRFQLRGFTRKRRSRPKPRRAAWRDEELTEGDRREIDQLIAEFEDPALRDSAAEMLGVYFRRKKYRQRRKVAQDTKR